MVVWSKGMLFTYNSYGIAQRPFRSYSYKNQSIMALAHRLLRDVPADGEAVLSRRARAGVSNPRNRRGVAPVDPSTDLLTFLKPHERHPSRAVQAIRKTARTEPADPDSALASTPGGNAERISRWDDVAAGCRTGAAKCLEGQLPQLEFSGGDGGHPGGDPGPVPLRCGSAAGQGSTYEETDALEYALVILLTVMFSPLSFNYAYVWLIYPMTLGLHLVMSEAAGAPWHRLKVAWISGGVPDTRSCDTDAAPGASLRQPVPTSLAPALRPGCDAPCGRPQCPENLGVVSPASALRHNRRAIASVATTSGNS